MTKIARVARPIILFFVSVFAISLLLAQFGIVGTLELAIVAAASIAIVFPIEKSIRKKNSGRPSH